MKKVLLIASATIFAVACQKAQINGETIEPEKGDVIALNAGTGVSVEGKSRAGGVEQGLRTEFLLDDQIAFFAAYPDKTDPTKPSWTNSGNPTQDSINQVGPYFKNIPALCSAVANAGGAGGGSATNATFAWGPAGEANVEWNRIYPKNDKPIFIYGYYPYNASTDTVRIVNNGLNSAPQLLVALRADGTTQDTAETFANLGSVVNLQPDVLWASSTSADGESTVKRTDQISPLTFQHALAQIDFKIQKASGARICKFKEIKFKVPKLGEMNITTGDIVITKKGANYSAEELITYNITRPNEIINVTDSPESIFESEANRYLMTLPMTAEQTMDCSLSVTVSYSNTADSDFKTFEIPLSKSDGASGVTPLLKDIAKGKLNIITLNVLETGIAIEADIAPWETNTEESNLDVE